ncbi:MAG: hypothetical protein GQ558_07915, partial [Thermoplasmata archaeon]|nr:hypothetical protein [Thermoplasmata archaeon]
MSATGVLFDLKGVRTICVVMLLLLGSLVVAVDGIDRLVQDPGRPSPEYSTQVEGPITTNPLTDGGPIAPSFTENSGQFGQWPAKYYTMGRPFSVAFGEGWIAYCLQGEDSGGSRTSRVIRVSFEGAADASPEGQGTLGCVNNYLHGQEPSSWITDVPNYERIVYPDLWEGIDMAFYFADGELKYEFTVAPGADPSSIVMVYEGMDTMDVHEATGDLLVRAGSLVLRDRAPVSIQHGDGDPVEVATEFEILDGGRVGFALDRYDPDLALTIDPGMMFCTFLGESGDDEGYDVVADQDGHAYVAGLTTSAKFPLTAGAYDTSTSSKEAFVSKFSPNGSTLEYSTFIGGDQYDTAVGIAVDYDGNVYLAGITNSTDFPTTGGAFCTTRPGSHDTFVLKLNVTGSSLEYSTYIGGSGYEIAEGIGIDDSGSVYITGWTYSTDFPTVDGSFRKSGNSSDIYVVKLSGDGSDLEYSVLIGGEYGDKPNDIAIDEAGCAYITGWTNSKDYPIVSGAFNPGFMSESEKYSDAFVTKLNPTGGSLVYSSFIGHLYDDIGIGIDVDSEGCVYVVGTTQSGFFPTKPLLAPLPTGPLRLSFDAFILKLGARGHYLNYSKVLGASSAWDEARSVTVDSEGCAFVTGRMNGGELSTTY